MFGIKFSSNTDLNETSTGLDIMRKHQQTFSKKNDLEFDYRSGLEGIALNTEDVKKSTFLRFCNALNLLATLVSCSFILLNLWFLVLPCNKFIAFKVLFSGNWEALLADLPLAFVRLYSVFFATLVIFAERENSYAAKNFSFLDSWISRGLFVIFLGSLQIMCKVPCELLVHYHLNLMVGGVAVVLGSIYTCLGMLCFRQLRNRSIEQIRKRKHVELQAKQLVDQKGEIEALLAETQKQLQLA